MRVVPALVVVLLARVMLMFAATSSEITGSKSPPLPRPPPKPIELDLGVSPHDVDNAKYSAFIATLRLKLKDPRQWRFGILILRKLSQLEYMYVKFISANGNSVVLAIRKNNMYVLGYSYKNSNKVHARFFKDIIDSKEYKGIFPEAQNSVKENIGY